MNTKRNSCSACTMIAAGVKFRKDPRHTCDELRRITFKLPKLDHDKWVEVVIQRGGYVDTGKATHVRCQPQEIEGVAIPQGFEIWVPFGSILGPHRSHSTRPGVYIKGWKINEVLKTIVMEGLRNG